MSSVVFKKHRVFRETDSVIFYDISIEDSNASDLVVHEGPAISRALLSHHQMIV